MKKVIFNRQPWPFPWIMNEYLDNIRWSYFLIPSGTVRSKQLWGKPCLFAEKDFCCSMSENVHSAPGSLCLLAAGLYKQGERITSENKPNAVRRSNDQKDIILLPWLTHKPEGWKIKHMQVEEAQTTCIYGMLKNNKSAQMWVLPNTWAERGWFPLRTPTVSVSVVHNQRKILAHP